MATNYPAYTLKSIFAAAAADEDFQIPPALAQDAGTGRLSLEKGWEKVNALPIAEGGIPPKREDINGALRLLSSFLLWYQQGGVMKYSPAFDYEEGNEVFHSGTKFRCLKANGPSSATVAPGADKTVWKNLDAPSVIAGQITPFWNCRLGGSDGRRLIPWGESAADERYVLCDGGSDGLGGNVPNLVDRFILPGTPDTAGQTGGSQEASTDSKKISGTVGEHVLTIDEMPKHTHSGSTSSAGSHSHSRGSMNITGRLALYDHPGNGPVGSSGAFYFSENYNSNTKSAGGDDWGKWYGFDASRSWSGYTSSDGSHSHSMSLASAGGGQGHTHSLEGASHSHSIELPLPPFLKLAFFVKLPE